MGDPGTKLEPPSTTPESRLTRVGRRLQEPFTTTATPVEVETKDTSPFLDEGPGTGAGPHWDDAKRLMYRVDHLQVVLAPRRPPV